MGLPDADEALAKAKIAYMVNSAIREQGLTQVEAARVLRIDQPNVSRLMRGRLSGFSLERLFHFLTLLDLDVEVRVTRKAKERGRLLVHVGN